MSPQALWRILAEVYDKWSDDKASRLAAALAFYTILSLAPVLVIVIAIAGIAFGEPVVRDEIAAAFQTMVGSDGARAIEMVMESAAMPGHSTIAEYAALLVLIFGACEVFIQLKDSLNEIWNVEPMQDQGIMGEIRRYFLSLSMVMGVAFLLLAGLVVSAALLAFGTFIDCYLPDNDIFLGMVNFLASFIVITLIFALIYKTVPDAEIAWSDVCIGAAITSLLFIAGKSLIGLYIAYSSEGSAYGAAGSLVVLMIWVYYSAQIFLMGAEFTQVYAERFGSKIRPELSSAQDDGCQSP